MGRVTTTQTGRDNNKRSEGTAFQADAAVLFPVPGITVPVPDIMLHSLFTAFAHLMGMKRAKRTFNHI